MSTKKAARVLGVPVQQRRLLILFSSSIVLRNSH
nr:MAG TPA: pathogenicity island protein [Caudoviricetes sp.]